MSKDKKDIFKFLDILNNSSERYSIHKNVNKEGLNIDEQDNECYTRVKLTYEYVSFYFDEATGKLISVDNEKDY